MIMAPKLMTMNIHLDLTNARTSAWNKTCANYSNPLCDWWLQNHRPIGHRTKRDIIPTLLGGTGTGTEILNSFAIETLANKLSVLGETEAGVTRMTASWLSTALQTSVQNWQGTWHLRGHTNVSLWSQLLTTKNISGEDGSALSCIVFQLTSIYQINQIWVAIENSQGQTLERLFPDLVKDKFKGGWLKTTEGPYYNADTKELIFQLSGIGRLGTLTQK